MLLFLNVIGRALAWAPEWVAQGLCWALGNFIYYCLPSRRRLVLSNLSHAFPKESLHKLKIIGRTSCRRTMEMGLFSLASPFFSEARVKKQFLVVANIKKLELEIGSRKRPQVVIVPHFAEMEAITMLPEVWSITMPETGVIYRPFKNKNLEKYVKRTRERFGLKLLSRRDGFHQAGEILRRNGWIAVLFDQNAGKHGVLSTFMGRIASTSELAGLLVQKFDADLLAVYVRRAGFWRAELFAEQVECNHSKTEVTLNANRWLENLLQENVKKRLSSAEATAQARMFSKKDATTAADWLWLHSRWRTQDEPQARFRLEMRKSILPETLSFYDKEALDLTYRLWVRLPNWLGDVVMALPLLRALKEGRPDVELTLIGQAPVLELLEKLEIGHKYVPLPKRSWSYFSKFISLRNAFPDTQLMFTNSMRGDIEARIIGAPQRFGMRRPGKKRPLLTHNWDVPASLNESEIHQTRVWEQYLQHFGLKAQLPLSPLSLEADQAIAKQCSIGIIAGTENSPEKRWPVEHWNALLDDIEQAHPNAHCHLFGTPRDAAITEQLAQGRDCEKIHNLAGKTNLIEFAKKIAACDVVICNDTGGMHLANILGVPVIAIYGPTNPVRTGPIFNSPKTILQPEGSLPTGGAPIKDLYPNRVMEALKAYIVH